MQYVRPVGTSAKNITTKLGKISPSSSAQSLSSSESSSSLLSNHIALPLPAAMKATGANPAFTHSPGKPAGPRPMPEKRAGSPLLSESRQRLRPQGPRPMAGAITNSNDLLARSSFSRSLSVPSISASGPLSGSPLQSARPLPEPPVQSARPLPEPPVQSARPLPEPPVQSARPLPEPPVQSARPLPEPPVQSARPLPEPPVQSARPLPELPDSRISTASGIPVSDGVTNRSVKQLNKNTPYLPVKNGRHNTQNLNGHQALNGVVCRHLAWFWLFGNLSKQEFLQRASSLDSLAPLMANQSATIHKQILELAVNHGQGSKLIHHHHFGEWLSHTVQNMVDNGVTHSRIFTALIQQQPHAVGINIELKPNENKAGGRVCITAYDPNLTGNHYRYECDLNNRARALREQTMSSLLPLSLEPSVDGHEDQTLFIPFSPDLDWTAPGMPDSFPLPDSFEPDKNLANCLLTLYNFDAVDHYCSYLKEQGISGQDARGYLKSENERGTPSQLARKVQALLSDKIKSSSATSDDISFKAVTKMYLTLANAMKTLELPQRDIQACFNAVIHDNHSGKSQPFSRFLSQNLSADDPFHQEYAEALLNSSLNENEKLRILNS